uniref:J domain-containing protein n=1 Tax=Gouania willdenowi TaxID=441366 RepID=A0A8C5GQQ6_GOUWI
MQLKVMDFKFKKINQAYEVLSDEKRRKTYDQFGAEAANSNHGFNQSGFSGFSGFEDIFEHFSSNSSSGSGGFDDIFSSFFGGGTRRSTSQGENLNLHVEIEIPFITIIRANPTKLNSISNCSSCQGSGVVNTTQKIPFFGTVNSQSTCPKCYGEGKVTGKGHQRLGITGDLYITIYVIPSNVFKRDSKYVYTVLNIDPLHAIVGGIVEIATPYGFEKFNVPAGTEHGAEFIIKNKGTRLGVGSNKIGDLKLIINYTKPFHYDRKALDVLSKFIPKVNKRQVEYLQSARKEILTK